MRIFFKSMLVMTSLSTMVACSGQKANTGSHSGSVQLNSTAVINDPSLSAQQKSEKLSDMAEQMVTPTGFMFADELFDKALSMDANNKKAELYKSMLAAPMVLKGSLARVKKLADKNKSTREEYADALAQLPNGSVKTFLLDGPSDISTEVQAQALFDQVAKAQDLHRLFLKNNKNLELDLDLNIVDSTSFSHEVAEQCNTAKDVKSGVYITPDCPFFTEKKFKINRADIETLQQAAAGLQIYLILATSYNASGVAAASDKLIGQNSSNDVWFKELSKNFSFGKLRGQNLLRNIPAMGVDLVAGARYAVQIRDQLCPKDVTPETTGADRKYFSVPTYDGRPGYLFSSGICIHTQSDDGDQLEDVLKTIDVVLSGETMKAKFGTGDDLVRTKLLPMALISNPIQDLKALKPQFNNCGLVNHVADSTLGGLFPLGDANRALKGYEKDIGCSPFRNVIGE